jgi:hypothetical protein
VWLAYALTWRLDEDARGHGHFWPCDYYLTWANDSRFFFSFFILHDFTIVVLSRFLDCVRSHASSLAFLRYSALCWKENGKGCSWLVIFKRHASPKQTVRIRFSRPCSMEVGRGAIFVGAESCASKQAKRTHMTCAIFGNNVTEYSLA